MYTHKIKHTHFTNLKDDQHNPSLVYQPVNHRITLNTELRRHILRGLGDFSDSVIVSLDLHKGRTFCFHVTEISSQHHRLHHQQ